MVAQHRILVVDDDPTVRESCRRVLSDRGYDVETTASGKEGLERARRGYFDCALLDLKMPDMDGMEIVRNARASRSNMAVLIITGYGSVDTAAEATRLGVSDYLSKPFTPEEITQAVDRALTAAPRAGSAVGVEQLLKTIREAAPKPDHYDHRSPQGVAQVMAETVGVKKGAGSLTNTVILGGLAGAYIAFGAALATLVGHDLAKYVGVGLTQFFTGAVFSVGLILVVIAGAELFTGNNLMFMSALDGRIKWRTLLEKWAVVYAANFAGAMILVGIMYGSGLWKVGADYGVARRALAIADAKVNLSFHAALLRGIACNWLVCLAVWMAMAARDISSKVLAIFFPIMAFVALGYEHSVANMYFIPLGLFLKATPAAQAYGASLEGLTWGRFLVKNLLPVSIGNIIGGAGFVGLAYWVVYLRIRGPQHRAYRSRCLEHLESAHMPSSTNHSPRRPDLAILDGPQGRGRTPPC